MKLLITGGAGFIGANLISYILKNQEIDEVLVFDDCSHCDDSYICMITNGSFVLKNGYKELTCQEEGKSVIIKLITADILNREAFLNACEGVDAIVHLAAFTKVVESVENPDWAININIVGTYNVLECAHLQGVKNVVIASSNGAVGEANGAVDENILPRPMSPYGATKLCGEALGGSYAECYGMTVTALRFANAYGIYSNHKTSVVAKMLKEIINDQDLTIYGDGTQTRDFINAQDIARAIWLSLQQKQGFELFQVASAIETSVNDLVKVICKVTGKTPKVNYVPERTGEIKRNYSNIDKISNLLGFKPKIDLEAGIRELYTYLLETEKYI